MEGEKCLKYKSGWIEVTVSLPEWGQGCKYCYLFCRKNSETGGFYCILTGEPINRQLMETEIGLRCPVEWEDEHG